ncbi:MAG: hypothetical protein IIV63_04855, partial [Clostridia bacterium]|nr:hypothetical protein [Clostridia bacterium]
MGQYSQPLTMNNLNQNGQPLNSNNGFPGVTTEGEAKIKGRPARHPLLQRPFSRKGKGLLPFSRLNFG